MAWLDGEPRRHGLTKAGDLQRASKPAMPTVPKRGGLGMTRTRREGAMVGLCVATLLAGTIGTTMPSPAQAFCGFYVAGADTSLYANASMVVLMREGTNTVLSMQNNYQGPPEDFALVIPVPTVLTEDQVKILPSEVFAHVDALSAPRLVEYWEVDPCDPFDCTGCVDAAASGDPTARERDDEGGVTVEAQFTVGEYEVVILSASDSMGLDTWLRDNDYNIPPGAEPILAPYVAAGTKFFVAKVDPSKVSFENGQAALSPLRFHYDSEDFSLPVRLGLLNSQGIQDLIVNILAQDRYEVANYDNAFIPTNVRVQNEVRDEFGVFYESLFTELLDKQPGAVVTEYSWDASTCDPCPTPPLEPSELATLGADVTRDQGQQQDRFSAGYTLTRLHYRYTQDTLGEDLVFKRADPVVGGRGTPDQQGILEKTEVSPSGFNNFQGRYIILHPWEGDIGCQEPQRGFWGGPQGEGDPMTQGSRNQALSGVAPKATSLPRLLAEPIAELDVEPLLPLDPFEIREGDLPTPGERPASDGAVDAGERSMRSDTGDGCSCRIAAGSRRLSPAALGLLGLLAWHRRRRARR